MPTRSPTMAEVLEEWRNGILRDLRVAVPARVLRYDPATQLADVQPELQDYFFNEDDSVTSIPLPVLTNVPVLWHSAGGYALTLPMEPGDKVQVLLNDRSLDQWLAIGTEQAPIDQRRHNIKDAVAIPGLRDNQHSLPAAPTDGATLGRSNGLQVKVTQNNVLLGKTATQSAVNGDTYISAEMTMLGQLIVALNAVASAITSTTTITFNGPAAATACSTAAFAVQNMVDAQSGYKSSVVKVQP